MTLTDILSIVGAVTVLAGLILSEILFCAWFWRRNERQAELDAVLDELIRECEVSSRWIIPEPKGRG